MTPYDEYLIRVRTYRAFFAARGKLDFTEITIYAGALYRVQENGMHIRVGAKRK